MASKRDGVKTREWAKHLRKWGKRQQQKLSRSHGKKQAHEESKT